ncbi:hypothetical protein FAM09_13230 [Niastella caeni]|uniref:Uncharacterized protein n=1 Tax=Niastella caeni TaxID=2569763 RepID=A0A4S8HW78_9BACT|nr:hypothetical protein [Niastella caeni]THU39461.1 hypothetical protein FAM09_13230 [Niastella caeni]
MIRRRPSFLLVFLFLYAWPVYVWCQEYSYTRYDSKDGLGSSTVNCMTQDKEVVWHATRETFLNSPTLPSGDYQLQAINKFDVHSKILTAWFTIDKLLYEKNRFRLLIGLAFLTITGLLVWVIIKRVRQSKGLSLTADRITMFNKEHE